MGAGTSGCWQTEVETRTELSVAPSAASAQNPASALASAAASPAAPREATQAEVQGVEHGAEGQPDAASTWKRRQSGTLSLPPDCLVQREWWWLAGPQKVPVGTDQWKMYSKAVQYHLSASLNAMQMEGRTEGLVLDLAPFTNPPSPYQVWRARPVEVANTKESELHGKLSIACLSKDLWDLPASQLPASAKHGVLEAGFYQVPKEDTQKLEDYNRYLQDPRSPSCPLTSPLRRRVVIAIKKERPEFIFGDVDRFRKKKKTVKEAAPVEVPVHDAVPVGEAVFQWWWGEPVEGGIGHWKNYHPHVSARLEQAFSENDGFKNSLEAIPIDEVRYSLQRISRERPFDYTDESSLGAGFLETFLPSHIITVDFSLYDQRTRLLDNCFVQFQRRNPKRRRPVRRIRHGQAAGIKALDGDPCCVCFSDTGFLTGCEKGHAICGSCLRTGLRFIVGDVTQTENLLCGCLKVGDTMAFEHLTKIADETMQALLQEPPQGESECREFMIEVAQVRRAFQLAETIPNGLFKAKMDEWFEKVKKHLMEHLYHACSHPTCGMENWILRTDFDKLYRKHGKCVWECAMGHRNSVLPSQEDIDDINRNLLMHPEYYTNTCGHDQMQLRRFRLCGPCVNEGLLTFAVHEEGCKQWPGSVTGHKHCFCFHCTTVWGTAHGLCNHSKKCHDPGIQQVRRTIDGRGSEKLEIGFVRGEAYVKWVHTGRSCPPTIFPDGMTVLGETRQGQLGLEDRTVLKRLMEEGTT